MKHEAVRFSALICLMVLYSATAFADQPKEVTLSFKSNPTGVAVSVDGTERCKTPCFVKVFKGTHVIGMERKGYKAKENMEDCAKDRMIRWTLKAFDGILDIESDPEKLKIELVNNDTGKRKSLKTPVKGLKVKPGKYTVNLKEWGWIADPVQVEVIGGESAEAFLEAVLQHASLSVKFTGEGFNSKKVTITANGKKLKGTGPWTVKAGIYHIVIKYGRKKLLDQKVQLEKGGSMELAVTAEE